MKLNVIDWSALVLIIVGGLNWGLVGAFKFNLVDKIFGVDSLLSRVIYIVVGLSATYMIFAAIKMVSAARHESRVAA